MMFRERLEEICDRVPGTRVLSLVARDGIPVETVDRGSGLDLDVIVAELVAQVRVISDDHRDLNVGEVSSFAVTTDRYTIMVGAVTSEYYLLLVTTEPASHGRARFELRRARLSFEEDLVV